MLQKFKFLLVVLIPIFLSVSNVKSHIEGVIFDNYIEPVEGALVKVADAETKTDAEGNFVLDTDSPLPIKITFSKEGYETKEIELKDTSKKLKVVLEEEF